MDSSCYIFDNDASGKQFAEALGNATKRGVEARVLIDAAGTRYSWPRINHNLKHAHVAFTTDDRGRTLGVTGLG